MNAVVLLAAFAADLVVGDPVRGHPVALFGRVAGRLERAVYSPRRARGLVYAAALVGAAATAGELVARAASRARVGRAGALLVVTWISLGGRSLRREAQRVAERLEAGDLTGARALLPALVGRDAARLDEQGINRALVESLAENTTDAVTAALLWAAVAGPAGVAAYRAANTLDAMVGHRSERYREFGWAAARLDDVMGWPGARAGILLAALCAPLSGGSATATLRTARRDGPAHPSPNAGPMEAAFAGALAVSLGGPVSYGGHVEHRPQLGSGPAPGLADVDRAARLSLAVGATAAAGCAAARAAWDRTR